MNLLVTGGAGFIGSNFARYWVEQHPDDRIVVVDALTYAGNRESLADVWDRIAFEHADIADLERMEAVLSRPRHRRRRQLRGRVAQQPGDRRPAAVLPHQRARDRGDPRGGQAGRRRAVPSRVDLRGVRRPRPRHRRGVHRGLALPAADAVQRVQGRRRPRRAGLQRDVRPADHDQQLRQQLRAVPVPREDHPAVHHQRPRRQAAAALRLDREPPGVDPRDRPLHGHRGHPRAGPGGRDVPRRHRGREEHRGDRRRHPRRARQARQPEDDRPRPPGPRPPLHPRLVEDPATSWDGSRRSSSTTGFARRCEWYADNRTWWEPLRGRAPVAEESAWAR